MKNKKYRLYIAILLIQVALCFYGFAAFRHNPNGVIFCSWGDGLKNMFTLTTYVQEPLGKDGLFKYNSMAYPYGDYVYYTDNTALFSVPFRFFCKHIWDLSKYTTAIFGLFIISNILLCSLLVFHVFRRLFKNDLFPFIMGIILPWTSMQLQRIVRGHFNLSFTSLVLLAIYLIILWHKHRDDRRKQILVGLGMCLLSVFSFTAHGYYIAIITTFIAAMLFFYGLFNIKNPNGKFSIVASVVYAIAAVSLSLLLVSATDRYLPLRGEKAMGYDWMEQKVRFSALFTPYSYNKIAFPFSPLERENDVERAAYLGNIGVFAVVAIFIVSLFLRRTRRRVFAIQKDFFTDPLKASIFLGSLIMLFISMGEVYYTKVPYEDGYKLINILNPFYYIHFLTNRVEQFRSLERFIYPFYFGFYVWIGYLLVKLYEPASRWIQVVVMAAVLFLGLAELRDNVARMNKGADNDNPIGTYVTDRFRVPALNYSAYQAILPIPYYCIGSENYEYTIDADQEWLLYNFRLALKTKLPLMSYELSRVPPQHNVELINLVALDSMSTGLGKRLNDKPLLVVVNKKLIASGAKPGLPTKNAELLYSKVIGFAERNKANLQAIDSTEGIVYYNWYPKRH